MTVAEILGYVGIGIWVIVAILTIIGALKGRSRGICRQAVRTLTIVASVLISFLITNILYDSVCSMVAEQGLSGLLSSIGISLEEDATEILAKIDPTTLNLVLAIPLALVVIPLLFVLSFILVSAIMLIVHVLLCKIFGFAKWKNTSLTRILGAVLGAVQGFAVAVIIFVLPVGLASTVSTAVDDMKAANPDSETTKEVVEIYDENIKPLAEHSSVKVLGSLGGKALYNSLATVEVDGTSYNMSEDVVGPVLKLLTSGALSDLDFENLDEDTKAAFNALIEVANESPYVRTLLADILGVVAETIDSEMGDSGDGASGELMTSLLSIFIDMKPEEVAPTLEIIRDSLFFVTMADADWNGDLSAEDRAALNTLVAHTDDSIKAEILAEILDAVGTAFDSENETEDLTAGLIQAFFGVFVDITKTEVGPALKVIRDVFFMLDDEEVLTTLSSDTANLADVFAKKDSSGKNLITRLTDKLNSNDRTKALVSSFTKLSISVMAENMETPSGVEITAETYESVKTGVKDIAEINKTYQNATPGTPEFEEYKGAVSDTLSQTFTENGFEVEKSVVDEMANYVAENHKDQVEELSDDEVNTIILNYYSAYLQTQETPAP